MLDIFCLKKIGFYDLLHRKFHLRFLLLLPIYYGNKIDGEVF